MTQKLDELAEAVEQVRRDVSDIKDSLPRSWIKNDSNGHDRWNETLQVVRRNKWVRNGTIFALGVLVTVLAGVIIRDLELSWIQKAHRKKPEVRKMKFTLERDAYNNHEELIEHIEQGKYDGKLDALMQMEIRNKNRSSVIRAIADRISTINEKTVEVPE